MMIRPHFLALSLLLAACGASEPTPSDTDTGHDENGEHEEAPTQTTISADAARTAGIEVAEAAAGVIADEHEVQGLLTAVDGRVAQITARFPGPVRALHANPGDHVRRGQVLASIDSNLSLTAYDVTSPIDGVVMARQATLGMLAGEGAALYEVADLSVLWVDLHIFGADAQHIGAGSPVTVTRLSDGVSATTTLERVLPGTATASQSTVARARLTNSDGRWRPGSAVKARITVDRTPVALAVPLTALQTTGDHDVVYVQNGELYSIRPVKLGRRDAQHVQIVSGLEAGERVVVAQSFLVKADIEKSTVEDEH